jgi:signal transduction histidine kinase
MATGRIRKQVDRLGNMINELLEFTRGSQNSAVLAPTPFDLFVNHLIEDLRTEVKDRGTIIECLNEPPQVALLIDPNRLTHVFYNLVHNAVDAMQKGGKIFFSFELREREVITHIRDTGPGLAPEIISRLFEAFATFGKAHGSGLGLSICKKIVEDHKGSISAKNAPEGGAMFSFSLPLPPAAGTGAQA